MSSPALCSGMSGMEMGFIDYVEARRRKFSFQNFTD